MAVKKTSTRVLIAQNRKARHNYNIGDHFEAGIELTGTEVKSLRDGRASMGEAYAIERGGEVFLVNAHISEYKSGGRYNHAPLRERRLLLKKREINKLIGSLRRGGMTMVPLSLYFNKRGLAKISLGIAEGKKKVDKRETIKKRDWDREKHRLLKNNN